MIDFKNDYVKTNYPYIYKHKTKGIYAVNFKLHNKIYNTDPKVRKTNFKTIKEAQSFIAKKRVEFEEQGIPQPKKTELFKDVFDAYIKECELEVRKGKLAESTVDGKKTIFKNQILPKLGNVKIAEISEEHINKFHDDLLSMNCLREKDKKLANQTHIKVHKQLSAFLNYCVRKRLITYNPAGVVGNIKKEKKKEREYLTEKEVETLLSVVDNIRDFFIIELLFYTGLRISELLGLSIDSIITTDEGTSLNITETYYKGKIRPYAKTDESMDDLFLDDITVETYKVFLEYRKKNNITSKYLFANNRGKCEVIGDKAIRDMIKKYLKLAGIDKNITPHKLRHSHAAYLMNMGKTLEDIKKRLRHSDIRTTSNEYGHMYKERKILLANDITRLRTKHNETTKTGTPNGTPTDKNA